MLLKNENELWDWIEYYLKLRVPRQAVCPHHDAPFEYLKAAYFEPAKDLIVWAPRGGGKTRLAAVATLLDMLDKEGCAVRILGGSLEQSRRMWEHLLPDLQTLEMVPRTNKRQRDGRFELATGSSAAILPQSERAVRGLRVQKLRCDEVEMFEPHVWEAAQLITRSIPCSMVETGKITGSIEAISTFHEPGGLMQRIIDSAEERPDTRVIHWCILDVLEHCPDERKCETCPLFEDCRGLAKHEKCNGFYSIDDAIRQKQRVSKECWESEMLCKRPVTSGCVFPSFERSVHVRPSHDKFPADQITLAIDFGFHNPFVCLWIADDGHTCHVIDEYVQRSQIVEHHLREIEGRPFGNVRRVCCDPAGASRNDQTAESNVALLKRHHYHVHTKRSRIVEGLELIRAALRAGDGSTTLFIDPGCKQLIAALKAYKYPEDGGELPHKDGTHDHLIDALRYFYVNRRTGPIEMPRSY